MSDQRPACYAEHLEFLGYSCEWQQDGWLYAAHPMRWNFSLRPTELGIRLHCSIHLGLLTAPRQAASLQFLNRLNQNSHLARFTLDYESVADAFVVRARTTAPPEVRPTGVRRVDGHVAPRPGDAPRRTVGR